MTPINHLRGEGIHCGWFPEKMIHIISRRPPHFFHTHPGPTHWCANGVGKISCIFHSSPTKKESPQRNIECFLVASPAHLVLNRTSPRFHIDASKHKTQQITKHFRDLKWKNPHLHKLYVRLMQGKTPQNSHFLASAALHFWFTWNFEIPPPNAPHPPWK